MPQLEPIEGMILLDVAENVFSFVEVLYRPEIRQKLLSSFST